MKRIKATNGYTIYQATARDESKYDVCEGYFYLYFSSDIRDYGLTNCDWDWEAGTIEEAESFANGTNYAIAKEIVEETTTAASFEEIAEVEAKLDTGMSREDIESESDEDEEPTIEYGKEITSMTYTQITTTNDQTSSREISELKMIHLMSQIMILKQAGEDIEWHKITTPDYLRVERYECIRRMKDRTVTTVFVPNGYEKAWID